MSNVIVIKQFLSIDECSTILNDSLKNLELVDAQIYGGSKLEVIPEVRKSKISFISDMGFVNERLAGVLKERIKINGFDGTKLDDFQFTEYEATGHFDWHVDSTNDVYPDRYYSAIILLNDEYSGGELEIIESNQKTIIEKNIGNLILFPSTYRHRVLPILTGKRYSLVNWVSLVKTDSKKQNLL
jgi:predicted 2-oxoglutarate/Fe(II)-dependent dioxygenase YbiX